MTTPNDSHSIPGSSTQSGHAIALAAPVDRVPISDLELVRLTTAYVGQSVGEMFLGPGWVDDAGTACIVLVAHDKTIPRRVRSAGECAFAAWRWNHSPSVYFSLVLSLRGENLQPAPRWMRLSTDPVVQALRRERRLLVTVANEQGAHSGWYEAVFDHVPGLATTAAFDELFEFPVPGIPFSSIHTRFDISRRERLNDTGADQIPLWSAPVSDYWRLLNVERAPWRRDLLPRDLTRACWGQHAWGTRQSAAGAIQILIDRQRIDGVPPNVDRDGFLEPTSVLPPFFDALVRSWPILGRWLAALDGPAPNAESAHEAVVSTLNNPEALYAAVNRLLYTPGLDADLTLALHKTFIAGLLDTRITHQGTRRPALATVGQTALELRSVPFDLEVPGEWIETLWIRITTDWIELINSHCHTGPSEFPLPIRLLDRTFEGVALEGTVEDAETRLAALLLEAQEARQWSIPWGARVQVRFGSFEALRIFEIDGQFHCKFVDERELYCQVLLNLDATPATTEATIVIRRSGAEEGTVNEEAALILKLIAAAIVRDFLVVEERETLFNATLMRRRLRGRDIRTIVYLPRVRYTTPQLARIPLLVDPTTRARHHVAAHLRRATTASAGQRFLARRYGLKLPQGFTFVRPHERGLAEQAERVRIYRSRSASRMIFDELANAPEGTRPIWFEFEKDCKRFLQNRGLEVLHQAANRNGDGGVDLFAIGPRGETYVVQCKCWSPSRAIVPAVVRELAGAIQLADAGGSQSSRGILITTSSFSPAAISAADALGFEMVDGTHFAALT
jgi:hypothetical protein